MHQVDIFRENLASDWIGNHFSKAPKQKQKHGDGPERAAEENYERALRFVSNKFKRRFKEAGRKEEDFAIFKTTAVDSKNALKALSAVFTIFVRNQMKAMYEE